MVTQPFSATASTPPITAKPLSADGLASTNRGAGATGGAEDSGLALAPMRTKITVSELPPPIVP